MKIGFDPDKRARTFAHRGLDFLDSEQIFAGRHLSIEDDRQDYGETRFITFGILQDRMVVLVWTLRLDERRIISMRYASDKERARYAEALGGPR